MLQLEVETKFDPSSTITKAQSPINTLAPRRRVEFEALQAEYARFTNEKGHDAFTDALSSPTIVNSATVGLADSHVRHSPLLKQ